MTLDNKKTILLCVLVAFTISFSFKFTVLGNHHNVNYISIEEQKFYSQDFYENEKKILKNTGEDE